MNNDPILAHEEELRQAQLASDVAALDCPLDDELVFTTLHRSGMFKVTGIDNMEILKQALDVAKAFKPLTDKETADLLARTKKVAARGEFERFKTTNAFDGTAKNPAWLGEHDKGPG
jgi:hypothetical protein